MATQDPPAFNEVKDYEPTASKNLVGVQCMKLSRKPTRKGLEDLDTKAA